MYEKQQSSILTSSAVTLPTRLENDTNLSKINIPSNMPSKRPSVAFLSSENTTMNTSYQTTNSLMEYIPKQNQQQYNDSSFNCGTSILTDPQNAFLSITTQTVQTNQNISQYSQLTSQQNAFLSTTQQDVGLDTSINTNTNIPPRLHFDDPSAFLLQSEVFKFFVQDGELFLSNNISSYSTEIIEKNFTFDESSNEIIVFIGSQNARIQCINDEDFLIKKSLIQKLIADKNVKCFGYQNEIFVGLHRFRGEEIEIQLIQQGELYQLELMYQKQRILMCIDTEETIEEICDNLIKNRVRMG
ncbi:hypothetical protein SS50377_28402 [Spironucleus salmonicida]|uniref:Uncharacterized protein n=1 Tax=Spironucleus salmonicida TaxID=348837 RepID=V6LFB7_9EUKA|nr:hypothetical protein SS50377_28402 [Spironucleus salmonicida]|eukprot:EST43177.1 Hypothetical protein SS50377_17117 [Spironucleus salmonicida]